MNDFSYSFRQRHDVLWVHAEREKREDNAPETGRNPWGNREKPPGRGGGTAGETGRKGRGNRNTAAAVHYNAARR